MKIYKAPFYSEQQIEEADELHFPYSDKNATYVGLDHQYELTSAYFQERGVNLEQQIESRDPEKVAHFLKELRKKVYTYIYTHNRSTIRQLNYLIAKRAIRGYNPFEYRSAFLEAMFIEGQYLLANGDLSTVAGVDLDTMQNMSADVMRNQNRDMHKDCVQMLKVLGLNYYGRYNFIPQGDDW